MSIEQPRRPRQGGFTLVELLVSFAIGFVVLTAMASFAYYSSFALARILNYAEMDAASDSLINHFTRDARRVNRVKSSESHKVIFEDTDGKDLTYEYDSSKRTLTRDKQDGPKTVLLTQCDAFTFTLGKRDPAGSFENFPSSNASECKVIEVAWKCSRTILGMTNTANVSSAKIVIRRQE